MEGNLDHLSAMLPIDFFGLRMPLMHLDAFLFAEVKKKKYRLTHFSSLLGEKTHADVHMGWNTQGLLWHFRIDGLLQKSQFPEWDKGDAIELYIDTRALDSSRIHPFCHCFIILPGAAESAVHEVTPLRGEEERPLCDPKYVHIEIVTKSKSYEVNIEIKKEGLYGYAPFEVKKIKFAYCIHRFGEEKQHFVLSSKMISIGKHPNLWGLLDLKSSS